MAIHPTAIVDATAELDRSVEVGAYAVIGARARLGAGTCVHPHGFVGPDTILGQRCQVHPFAVAGYLPQDLKHDGSPAHTHVGDDTIIREHGTIHGGTSGGVTLVGSRCYIMSTGHIGHNCVVGDEVKVANSGLLSGHVEVGNGAFVSGNVSVNQFVRIGALAMLAGGIRVVSDVPPFMLAGPDGIVGVNVVGLRRAGLDSAARLELRECHRRLYRSGGRFREALAEVAQRVRTEPGRQLVAFLQAPSRRGLMKGARRSGAEHELESESA